MLCEASHQQSNTSAPSFIPPRENIFYLLSAGYELLQTAEGWKTANAKRCASLMHNIWSISYVQSDFSRDVEKTKRFAETLRESIGGNELVILDIVVVGVWMSANENIREESVWGV
jgi:uncharacterized membrane protein